MVLNFGADHRNVGGSFLKNSVACLSWYGVGGIVSQWYESDEVGNGYGVDEDFPDSALVAVARPLYTPLGGCRHNVRRHGCNLNGLIIEFHFAQ